MPASDTRSEATARPPLILLISDQEWFSLTTEQLLSASGFAVVRAYTGRHGLTLAATAIPDAIIVETRLPDIDGYEICRLLRDDDRDLSVTPVVLTSADHLDRKQVLEGLAAGAWDVVAQPIDGDAFVGKLRNFLRARRAVDRLRRDSLIDEGTGLYNLRGLTRRAQELAAEAQRQKLPLACVVLNAAIAVASSELQQGSSVAGTIPRLATAMRREGRLSDAVGRLGLCEFAVLAPCTSSAGAQELAERMRRVFAVSLSDSGLADCDVQISVEISEPVEQSEIDGVDLLLRASRAVRSQGRNATSVPTLSV